ncbi:MAG: trimethylamine methyltransferase family protein [candidate division WOR-3 bacterium]
MRPVLRLLEEDLITRILDEARDVLCRLGFEVHNSAALELLAAHGARIDQNSGRVLLRPELIDQALKTAPQRIQLFDALGQQTHDFSGGNVYFTPGSAALNILDPETQSIRRPKTSDYVAFVQLVSGLRYLASQSTALVPDDVPEPISDSYRLYLSLLLGEKPVVTGCFTIESFQVMKDMQCAVRGSERELAEKPLAIFSCCPTAPMKWSQIPAQNLLDCARARIPVELVAMPLAGFMAPVSLVGTVIQHTAEVLSGIVISQLACPGAPVLYGGSPAIFDVRRETTPMGAIETIMIDCACSEVGKYLGLPTQAYVALSDAKLLDAQAGLETGIGAVLAALSGINSISGPGMLDFESCQSLEKLVLDNEICGMALRLVQGIEPRDEFPIRPLLEELLRDKHLLISEHTRRWLRHEHFLPGPVIDRASSGRWLEQGGKTLGQRAREEKQKKIAAWRPSRLSTAAKTELTQLMNAEARRHGRAGLA